MKYNLKDIYQFEIPERRNQSTRDRFVSLALLEPDGNFDLKEFSSIRFVAICFANFFDEGTGLYISKSFSLSDDGFHIDNVMASLLNVIPDLQGAHKAEITNQKKALLTEEILKFIDKLNFISSLLPSSTGNNGDEAAANKGGSAGDNPSSDNGTGKEDTKSDQGVVTSDAI